MKNSCYQKYAVLTAVFAFSLLTTACKKSEVTPTAMLDQNPPAAELGNLFTSGTFVANDHATSGSAKVYEKDGKITLVFENFKTDNGPDLKVYLSKDLKASAFVDLGKLKSTNGNFNYATTANTEEYRYVLIWCKQFSALFGNAELKKVM